jgi:hypothetical protein
MATAPQKELGDGAEVTYTALITRFAPDEPCAGMYRIRAEVPCSFGAVPYSYMDRTVAGCIATIEYVIRRDFGGAARAIAITYPPIAQ